MCAVCLLYDIMYFKTLTGHIIKTLLLIMCVHNILLDYVVCLLATFSQKKRKEWKHMADISLCFISDTLTQHSKLGTQIMKIIIIIIIITIALFYWSTVLLFIIIM